MMTTKRKFGNYFRLPSTLTGKYGQMVAALFFVRFIRTRSPVQNSSDLTQHRRDNPILTKLTNSKHQTDKNIVKTVIF